MSHDPMCPAVSLAVEGKWVEEQLLCRCDLIARVRADEQARWLKSDHLDRALGLARQEERERHHDGGDCECTSVYADGTWLHASRNLAHAEAVAARLVEVICEDDVDRQDSFSMQVWRAEVIREQERVKLAALVTGIDWRNVPCECTDEPPCQDCLLQHVIDRVRV